jgi:hypothetical protein
MRKAGSAWQRKNARRTVGALLYFANGAIEKDRMNTHAGI